MYKQISLLETNISFEKALVNSAGIDLTDPQALRKLGVQILPVKYTTLMYSLLKAVDKIFNKYAIPYWLTSGGLFAYVQTGTLFPWDDDVDIAIPEAYEKKLGDPNLVKELALSGLGISHHPLFGYKIYANKDLGFGSYHSKTTGQDYPLPFMDLSITRVNNGEIEFAYEVARKHWPRKHMPLSALGSRPRVKFGPIEVHIPENPISFLDNAYDNWRTRAVFYYHHVVGHDNPTKFAKNILPGKWVKSEYDPVYLYYFMCK